MNAAMAKVFKRLHFPFDLLLLCVRWYVAYPLSLRHLGEMMTERGVAVDHATIHRWAIKILPILGKLLGQRRRRAGASWRMDETYIKINGTWKYLHRAVDKAGRTVDFLLRAKGARAAARVFFKKAIDHNGAPTVVTIDKSGSNLADLIEINAEREAEGDSAIGIRIRIRQLKYLNNIVEQDHRAIKRSPPSMLGFKSCRCAQILLGGIELMHRIKRGQITHHGTTVSTARQSHSLAA